jgi:ComF family protein
MHLPRFFLPRWTRPRFPGAGRWRARARDALAIARTRLPTDCPLCGASARGGALCGPCDHDVAGLLRSAAGTGMTWRCPRCALGLPEHDSPCPDCADRHTAFDRTVIALDYLPPADALILRMKAGRHYAQGDLLGNLLAEAIRHDGRGLPDGTVLLPVPASRSALRARGFNPAAEIARALGRDLGLPVRLDWLARTRQQAQQHTLGRLERREAAQGLYACAPGVRGRHLGIVDDVMTTGSTLHEIALALKAAGAASVTALVAARTPHPPADGTIGRAEVRKAVANLRRQRE